MPIYEINGRRVETDTPLSDDEIDEIAQSLSSKEATPPIPEPQNESLADIAKNMGLGLVSGAANIGNTLIDAATFIPRTLLSAAGSDTAETLNLDREASLRSFQKEAKAKGGLPFSAGELVSELAGTAGVGNLLKVPALGANMPRLAKALETGGFSALEGGSKTANALMRLAAGGAVGGASAGLIDPEDAGTGALVGAGTVGVGVPLIKGATLGAGKLYDLVSGNLPRVAAGRIARDIAGPELDAIRKANLGADDALTSAQATADVPRFEWQALGEKARAGDPTAFGLKADAQEASRLKALEDVTPDLQAAIQKRTEVSVPLYKEALESSKKVNTRPVVKLIDEFINDNPKLSSITSPLGSIKDDLYDASGEALDTNVKSLSSLSQNIKNKIEAKNPDGTPQFDVKALTKIKEKLDEQIGRAEPKYNEARETFKRLSAPVNQAQLLSAMKDTLVNTRGGERVTPFLNAMGPGEKSLFRKADQSPRFGSLDEVLSPQQRQVKDRIVRELKRDAEVSRRVKEASSKTSDIISGDSVKIRLPSLIDRWLSATKQGIDVAGEQINRKTMMALVEGMKTGKSANEMLATLPATERNKVLKALVEMPQGGTIPAASGALSAEGE